MSNSAVKKAIDEPRIASGVRVTVKPKRIGKAYPWPIPLSTPASATSFAELALASTTKPSTSAPSAGKSTRFSPMRFGSLARKTLTAMAVPA